MDTQAIEHYARDAMVARMARFPRDDEGSVTIFSLFIFILMVLIGGMAVDLMRFETRRAVLQGTVDSAVLAAADLDQQLDPETVVDSYFAKRGFDPDKVTVQEFPSYMSAGNELVGREVRVNTDLQVNTFFMHMMGIENLRAPITSAALEEVRNVEISLVLDISGSMRWDKNGNTPVVNGENRINDLKKSVIQFIDSVLQVECDDHDLRINCVQSPTTKSTTINIIPYAGHVNPGPYLFGLMGGQRWHNWSSCKEVTDADFDDADLPNASGDQLPHFMRWNIDTDWMKWGWCPQDDAAIMVAENDFTVLHDYVKNIKLHDGTATHVGMKYGLALLNPTSQDEFQALNGIVVNGRKIVADEYKNRPAAWEDDTLKFVVLMTDGKTTDQFRPKVGSDQWDYGPIRSALESNWEQGDEYNGSSFFEDALDRYGSYDSNGDENTSSDVEHSYPAATIYGDGSTMHNAGTNNAHITAMCNSAKQEVLDADGGTLKEDRVTVFTISFLAPESARTLMQNCASKPSHYFKVQDLNVGTAFKAIAKTINQLRLSQ